MKIVHIEVTEPGNLSLKSRHAHIDIGRCGDCSAELGNLATAAKTKNRMSPCRLRRGRTSSSSTLTGKPRSPSIACRSDDHGEHAIGERGRKGEPRLMRRVFESDIARVLELRAGA